METLQNIILSGINLPKDFNKKNLNYNSDSIKFEIGISDKKNNIYDYSIKFNRSKVLNERLEYNSKSIYEFKEDTLFSKKLPKEIIKIFSISSTETI